MRAKLHGLSGLAGFLAACAGMHPASAQDVNAFVRTLNVINPGDAQRREEQARRNGRAEEERYWRDYGAGLDARGPAQESRQGDRQPYRVGAIGSDEARRFEDQARRSRKYEEQRYWRDYRAGLGSGGHAPQYRDRDQQAYGIGSNEARRFEDQARRNRKYEEERYWRTYRAGLESHDPGYGEQKDHRSEQR